MAVAKLLLPSSLNLPSKLKITRVSPSLHNQPWSLKKKKRRHPPGDFLLASRDCNNRRSNPSVCACRRRRLWSLIKRSVKSKVVQKTFVEELKEGKKKEPNQIAGEILSFFTRNNFSVLDKGETITFEGTMVPSRGQAALLTFCTCISLGSVALVLTITVPDVGNNWFGLIVFSPLAGAYYWKRASRKEQIKVKMMVAEDGTLSEIVVQGDDQQVEQMRKELQLSEKGMVYVKGIFER
ncbi:unnamed protein product [Lactuca virosa]|uniref:Protein COFACTOR ASSEMBLY OF COMPLEX C SUBUNIT B CCB1, chloroplastic n=1 Tax=Lactuca virosa TaxID=75947 RepID=A0AAU9LES2_9ASTR|nr:unnamed protein product [Lactuca virosa]